MIAKLLVFAGKPDQDSCGDRCLPPMPGSRNSSGSSAPCSKSALRTSSCGAGDPGALPDGVLTLPNDVRLAQYVGPNPPPGSGRHRYVFVVHAVDLDVLDIDPGLTPTVLGFNLHFHTLARGHVTGWVDAEEA